MCPPSAGAIRLEEHIPAEQSASSAKAPDCVPSDSISQAAYAYAQQHLHPVILNHSLRVYLLAYGLGTRESSPLVGQEKLHLLFTACIIHDIGTTEAHNGAQRFEVEGADAASAFLTSRSHHDIPVSETEIHDVWTAIVIHTSPGIAERISPLARLVRMGVAMDFKRPAAMRLSVAEETQRVESLFPRGEIEKVLGDAVVEQVLRMESEGVGGEAVALKAGAGTWPGGLVKSKRENPGWKGVNKAF